jgi:hypothetical protein
VTQTSPAAGSIAVWPSSVGHVAYVDGVNAGGTINTEEYNWSGDGAYHTRANYNWSAAGVRFIHIKDLSSGGSGGGVQGMAYLGTNQVAHGRRMYPDQYLLSADARYVLTLDRREGARDRRRLCRLGRPQCRPVVAHQ